MLVVEAKSSALVILTMVLLIAACGDTNGTKTSPTADNSKDSPVHSPLEIQKFVLDLNVKQAPHKDVELKITKDRIVKLGQFEGKWRNYGSEASLQYLENLHTEPDTYSSGDEDTLIVQNEHLFDLDTGKFKKNNLSSFYDPDNRSTPQKTHHWQDASDAEKGPFEFVNSKTNKVLVTTKNWAYSSVDADERNTTALVQDSLAKKFYVVDLRTDKVTEIKLKPDSPRDAVLVEHDGKQYVVFEDSWSNKVILFKAPGGEFVRESSLPRSAWHEKSSPGASIVYVTNDTANGIRAVKINLVTGASTFDTSLSSSPTEGRDGFDVITWDKILVVATREAIWNVNIETGAVISTVLEPIWRTQEPVRVMNGYATLVHDESIIVQQIGDPVEKSDRQLLFLISVLTGRVLKEIDMTRVRRDPYCHETEFSTDLEYMHLYCPSSERGEQAYFVINLRRNQIAMRADSLTLYEDGPSPWTQTKHHLAVVRQEGSNEGYVVSNLKDTEQAFIPQKKSFPGLGKIHTVGLLNEEAAIVIFFENGFVKLTKG